MHQDTFVSCIIKHTLSMYLSENSAYSKVHSRIIDHALPELQLVLSFVQAHSRVHYYIEHTFLIQFYR